MLPTRFLKFSIGVTSVHRGDETIQALSSNQTVHILMIYLRYRSAFAPELPYKSIPQCKFYSTLHLTTVLSWFTRDYYANFWKNPHLSYAVMESPHVNTSAQRTTLEQKKPRPVLSTYHLSYFFPTFFLFLPGHHLTCRVLRCQQPSRQLTEPFLLCGH